VCFVIVTSLRIVTDGNKETTYLLTENIYRRRLVTQLMSTVKLLRLRHVKWLNIPTDTASLKLRSVCQI